MWSWHLGTHHPLPLYAVACWTSDGGSLGDAQERSQEARLMSHGRPIVSATVRDGFEQ